VSEERNTLSEDMEELVDRLWDFLVIMAPYVFKVWCFFGVVWLASLVFGL